MEFIKNTRVGKLTGVTSNHGRFYVVPLSAEMAELANNFPQRTNLTGRTDYTDNMTFEDEDGNTIRLEVVIEDPNLVSRFGERNRIIGFITNDGSLFWRYNNPNDEDNEMYVHEYASQFRMPLIPIDERMYVENPGVRSFTPYHVQGGIDNGIY